MKTKVFVFASLLLIVLSAFSLGDFFTKDTETKIYYTLVSRSIPTVIPEQECFYGVLGIEYFETGGPARFMGYSKVCVTDLAVYRLTSEEMTDYMTVGSPTNGDETP